MANAYDLALAEIRAVKAHDGSGQLTDLERIQTAQALALVAAVDELRVISARLDSIDSRIPYAPFPK